MTHIRKILIANRGEIALRIMRTCRRMGIGSSGKLGTGDTATIGEDETPGCTGDVDLGGKAVQISGGTSHTCALLEGGAVRCWGSGELGRLGYGNTNNIGDDEAPSTAGDVDVGGTVIQIAASNGHTCALLEGGTVRCWGRGLGGYLGYGNHVSIGDDEAPSTAGDLDLGGPVTRISAGYGHTCALLEDGAVRCWGQNYANQLGHDLGTIGGNETPASVAPVDVGGPAIDVAAGGAHSCALLATGAVRCWGRPTQAGYGNGLPVGDDETPAEAGDLDLGGPAVDIEAGGNHTCALLEDGAVRCWGLGNDGVLGYGNEEHIGDDEVPSVAGDVDVGGTVQRLALGSKHSCALLEGGAVRCWGEASAGPLGYGLPHDMGDDEAPSTAGDVPVDACSMPSACELGGALPCQADSFEPNDSANAASVVFMAPFSTGDGYYSESFPEQFLCAGEEDWFHVSIDHLSLGANMRLHVSAMNDIYRFDCNACDSADVLPACPHNTLHVEVYDAQTGALLETEAGMQGYVWMNRDGLPAGDVRVRVRGEPEAGLPYKLKFAVVDESNCSDESCRLPRFCDHC